MYINGEFSTHLLCIAFVVEEAGEEPGRRPWERMMGILLWSHTGRLSLPEVQMGVYLNIIGRPSRTTDHTSSDSRPPMRMRTDHGKDRETLETML